MKRFSLVLAMFALACSAGAGMPRLAVMSLENKSGYRGSEMDIGSGMADMLITEFVNTKKLRVVERAELEKLTKEQNLGASGALSPQTAAKIGQILGVEYIAIGSINEFGVSESTPGALGSAVVNHKASVGLDIRVIDASSGEVAAAATGKGEKNRKGTGVSNSDIFPTGVTLGSPDFSSSLMGKATREAVKDAVLKVVGSISGNWKGTVIKVSPENKVTINGGDNAGITPGDVFEVIRKGEEMKDPETGEVLGAEETLMGEIEITDVKPKYSVGDVISGSGIQANDKVQSRQDKKKK